MSNELVRWVKGPGDVELVNHSDAEGESEWDLPPEEMGYGPRPAGVGPVHTPQTWAAVRQAERDATRARSLGDTTFAAVREGDVGDLTQTLWDWGDLRTWLWFAAMFFGFLLLVACCYFLPEGQHASPPPIRPY